MTVKLHRCKNEWAKLPAHPCWKVEKALKDMNIDYVLAPGPWRGERPQQVEHTGARSYPAIEFEDGTWYREQSKDMAAAIRAGKLEEMRGKTPKSASA